MVKGGGACLVFGRMMLHCTQGIFLSCMICDVPRKKKSRHPFPSGALKTLSDGFFSKDVSLALKMTMPYYACFFG